MAFDGITLNSIVFELQDLIGAKVDYVFEPTPTSLLIGLYKDKHYALNIDLSADNYRLHLTTHTKPNPMVAPNFCMVLRKNLMGYRIKKIYQNGLERICYIEFEGLNTIDDTVTKTLAIELMGRFSNSVLINSDFIIIDALKRFSTAESSRHILPGQYYILPEKNNQQDLTILDKKQFTNILLNCEFKTIINAVPNVFIGISKQFIEYAILYLKITNTVSVSNLYSLYDYLSGILEEHKFTCVLVNKGYTITEAETRDSFEVNFIIDDFYDEKTSNEEFVNYRNQLLRVINGTLDKITRKMKNIDSKISSCSNMDKYKLYGEILNANIYKYPEPNFKDKSIKSLNLYNYCEDTMIDIPIDPTLSLSKNAQKYFKKYAKLKSTLEITKVQKQDTEKELNYLESILYELSDSRDIASLDSIFEEISENILFTDTSSMDKIKQKKNQYNGKKPKNKELESLKNYIRFKIDDYDVLVGKNNKQNDYLTKTVAKPNDLWFHTKEIHGSHVILKCEGDMPKITTLNKVAKIAAYYSKAKYSSHVPVDYTLIKNVKKPNHSAPGYVIYTDNKTLYVDPETPVADGIKK